MKGGESYLDFVEAHKLNQKVNLIIENVLTRAVINIYLIIVYFIFSLIYIV